MATQEQKRCRKHRRDRRPRRSVAKVFAISKLAKSFLLQGFVCSRKRNRISSFSDRRGRRSLQCLDQIRSSANTPLNINLTIKGDRLAVALCYFFFALDFGRLLVRLVSSLPMGCACFLIAGFFAPVGFHLSLVLTRVMLPVLTNFSMVLPAVLPD